MLVASFALDSRCAADGEVGESESECVSECAVGEESAGGGAIEATEGEEERGGTVTVTVAVAVRGAGGDGNIDGGAEESSDIGEGGRVKESLISVCGCGCRPHYHGNWVGQCGWMDGWRCVR